MLDNNLKIEKKESNDFPPLPKNIYQVELLDVNSEKRPTYDTRNKPDGEKEYETVLNFQFTLLAGKDKNESLRGRNVWANFIPMYFYISKKSGENKTLKLVKSFLGRDLTQKEEAEGVTGEFLNSLIGKQCRVSVEPKLSSDKYFDSITDFYAVEGNLQALNDDEKDKSRVKKTQPTAEDISLSEEYPQEGQETHPQYSPADDIDVTKIPF